MSAPVLNAPPSGGSFEPAPEGTHVATCYRVIDIGTQTGQFGPKRTILVGWELTELMDDGEPFVAQRRYTLSLHKKATLRLHVEALLGKRMTDEQAASFNVCTLIRKAGLITVTHTERDGVTFANIDAVTALPKGTKKPEQTLDPQVLVLEKAHFNSDVYEALSERLRESIMSTPEFAALNS